MPAFNRIQFSTKQDLLENLFNDETFELCFPCDIGMESTAFLKSKEERNVVDILESYKP